MRAPGVAVDFACGAGRRLALVAAVVAGSALLAADEARGQRFTPAADPSPEAAQWAVARQELSAGKAREAYERIAKAIERDPRGLVRLGESDNTRALLAGWAAMAESLPPEVRAALAAQADGADARELTLLMQRADADPTEFVALARRHPFGQAAIDATLEAARRLLARGDALGAAELVARAKRSGATSVPEIASPAVRVEVPLLVEYWWFQRMPDRLSGIRAFPARAGAWVFAASATHVLALREITGGGAKVEWGFPSLPVAPPPGSGDRNAATPSNEWQAGRLDFPTFEPAVFADDSGAARVVVVRQQGDRGGVVRALRAADGRLLWETQDDARLAGLQFCSSPAVAGRYVYVLASDGVKDRPAALHLVALDLMTGTPLFRSRLGGLSEVPDAKRGRRGTDPTDMGRGAGLWDEQTPVAVVGDEIYVAPGGSVFQLDRFDGSVLRVATYVPGATLAKEGNMPTELPMSRWSTTPVAVGQAVVVTPRDTEDVLAFERATMRPLWRARRSGAFTPIGPAETTAGAAIVLQSRDEVIALGMGDGQPVWRTPSRTQTQFTGPAALTGDVVVVPTDKGVMALSARDGKWLPEVPVRVTEVRPWLSGEVASALRRANVLAAWSGVRTRSNPLTGPQRRGGQPGFGVPR